MRKLITGGGEVLTKRLIKDYLKVDVTDDDELIEYISSHFYETDEYVNELHRKMQELTIAIAKISGVPYHELRLNDGCRKRNYVYIRQKVMYVTWMLTRRNKPTPSLKDIGDFFSKKDHATVIYSMKTIRDLLSYKQHLVDEIQAYCEMFKETFSGA